MRTSGFRFKWLLLVVFIVLISVQGQSQHRIVLLHPTASNIENMVWLVEDRIIDIPDLEILGVYASNEAYDYSASEKYLNQHHISYFRLRGLEGQLKPEDIYRENKFTPAFRALFKESDAILFLGGPDIPAAIYGEKQNQLTVVTDPNRHYFETSLFFHLTGGSRNPLFEPFLADKPDFIIRAFCLGMQTMNVAAGGTLIQDIPSELYHKNTLEEIADQPIENLHRSSLAPLYPSLDLFPGIFHQIRIGETGYLKEIADKSGNFFPEVLSAHHQAVGRKGADLTVIATSMDNKIIEGLQHTVFKNVVGVQFHPEAAALYKTEATLVYCPDSAFSPNKLLLKSKSLSFYQLFWKDFSIKVAENHRMPKN